MIPSYPLLLILFLFALILRSIYEILRDKGHIKQAKGWIFIMVLVAMFLLWMSWFSMCPIDPVQVILPALVSIIGLIITITGLVLALAAFIQLRGVEDIDHLVTKGVFSKLRHPMYTGFICWIVGWILRYGAMVSIIPGCILIICIIWWMRVEERSLIKQHGDQYLNYKQKTWF